MYGSQEIIETFITRTAKRTAKSTGHVIFLIRNIESFITSI